MFQQAIVDRSSRTRLCFVGILLSLFVCQAQILWAQAPAAQQAPAKFLSALSEDDPEYQRLKKLKRSSTAYSNSRADVVKWYTEFFKSFTHRDKLGQLAEKRQEVVKDLLSARGNPELHSFLLTMTREYMGYIARNKSPTSAFDFHPAVRFNAMLLIGELNAVERGGGNNKFPVADPESLGILYQEFVNTEQIDAVCVAAMIGILRHARLDWASPPGSPAIGTDGRRVISDAMLTVLTQKETPEGRDPQAHLWMRRRAVEIVAALKALGNRAQDTAAISAIIADADEDMMLRCTAARSLQLYQAKGASKLNLTDTARELAALAVAASRSELDWISEYNRDKATKEEPEPMSIASFTGSLGGVASAVAADEALSMMGVEQNTNNEDDQSTGFDALVGGGPVVEEGDPEVVLARRRILTKLDQIQKGLAAITAAATEEEKPQLAPINEMMTELLNSTRPPEDQADLLGLARSVSRAVRKLDQFTKSARPAGNATAATGS